MKYLAPELLLTLESPHESSSQPRLESKNLSFSVTDEEINPASCVEFSMYRTDPECLQLIKCDPCEMSGD